MLNILRATPSDAQEACYRFIVSYIGFRRSKRLKYENEQIVVLYV